VEDQVDVDDVSIDTYGQGTVPELSTELFIDVQEFSGGNIQGGGEVEQTLVQQPTLA
jgi:hypothetical protein